MWDVSLLHRCQPRFYRQIKQHRVLNTYRLSKEYRKFWHDLDQLTTGLKDLLSITDFYILRRALQYNIIKKTTVKIVRTHEQKLKNLTRNTVIPFTSDDTVNNLSTCHLTTEQLDILKFGLTHSICPPKVRTSDVFTCFELINHTVAQNLQATNQAGKLIA